MIFICIRPISSAITLPVFFYSGTFFQRLFNIVWDRQNITWIPITVDRHLSKNKKTIKNLENNKKSLL
ncbi:hypothetical protein MSKOL_1859 [Methanosarcina sp. Kolksee]|uniref:Uncharacterized protein n=1 Tax=Methanosarcina vacuolata Z-761 TaxID=1434123 RepID=A0A0E3LHE7_9EURY|nr:hypothetical protein MSVAZ_1872 [Methanosarcina vacuolata Z-761]AKB47636.1 hypothetical protein MSKOL_1859 [Methanosarcina sp. Kolksee]